jgi:membrane protease subunit (stomatin/prohibitin family)
MGKASNDSFTDWFREFVLRTIKDDIADLIVKQKWPLLDVTSGAFTEEIITEVVKGMRPGIEPYGIEVVTIGNFNLGMKDEDEKKLSKLYENAAYMNMAGGAAGFQQVATASAMMSAGEGMAQPGGGGGGGNAALTGAGLGVGMAMANNMANAQAQAAQQPQRQPNLPGGAPPAGGAAAVTCGKCQKQVAPGKFCAECGAPMAAAGPKFCAQCGVQLAAGSKFCSGCGTAAPA